MPDRIFVAGGAGFIGSNFVQYLLQTTSHKVTILDALTYAGTRKNLENVADHPRQEFVEGNIRDSRVIDDLVANSDVIVNFAAQTHVDRSIENSEPFVRCNVDGTRSLLDTAVEQDIDIFVQISTDEVYGDILDGKFNEESPLSPRNPYSATKAGADHLVLSYHETHGLPVCIARPSNNFGPRQHSEKLIPKFISRAASGETLPVYGDGTNVREWTYVHDNCRAIELLMNEGNIGEIYNIGSGDKLTNIDVTERILDIVGASRDLIEFVDDRPGHDQRYALDTSKIRSLGWEPKWSFSEGLEETVEYYLS